MRKLLGEKKPADLVMALAETKADAIVSRLKTTAQFEVEAHSTLLITADTVIPEQPVFLFFWALIAHKSQL
ncbi:hypothetical protein I3760_01G037200 [Carya illinoinensis]|nr:hypothetical protein I3760_01G037200 [Carya illinoinensis]